MARSPQGRPLLLLGLIIWLSTCAARAEDHGGSGIPKAAVDAKLAYCKTCHNLSAQGFRASFPIPRLAGQQPEYIENQLQAFMEYRRRFRPVINNTHRMSEGMVSMVAQHFQDLTPRPLGGGRCKSDTASGQRIFVEGVPGADVPPCAMCHGADAKGTGAFPRLAGQLSDYIVNKLANWGKERGQDKSKPDNSEIMAPIAQKLTAVQMQDVAAYLSTLDRR